MFEFLKKLFKKKEKVEKFKIEVKIPEKQEEAGINLYRRIRQQIQREKRYAQRLTRLYAK